MGNLVLKFKLIWFILDQSFQQGLNYEGGMMMSDEKRLAKSCAHDKLIAEAIKEFKSL